jgi:rhodanese-related sulfurtransferase
MKKIISGVFVLLLLLLSTVAYAELTPPLPGTPTYDISVEEAYKMLEENAGETILLDVRTEGESAEHINMPNVELINIPKDAVESRLDELDNSKSIIVYCKSGGRSSAAKDILTQHDFIVYNMLGGITAWKAKYDTSTTTADAVTPSPAVSPVLTPATASTPVTSPVHTPTVVSSTTSPVTTPAHGEEKEVPGFEVITALAAISLIAWRRSLRKQ